MREIKFRAWDEKFEEWLEPEDHVIYADNGDIGEVNNNELVESIVHNTLVEQYTGLHDESGNKIYEGDILRLYVGQCSEVGDNGFVEYRHNLGYCINFEKTTLSQEYWAANDKYTVAVIGNIHENPELLEEKQ